MSFQDVASAVALFGLFGNGGRQAMRCQQAFSASTMPLNDFTRVSVGKDPPSSDELHPAARRGTTEAPLRHPLAVAAPPQRTKLKSGVFMIHERGQGLRKVDDFCCKTAISASRKRHFYGAECPSIEPSRDGPCIFIIRWRITTFTRTIHTTV